MAGPDFTVPIFCGGGCALRRPSSKSAIGDYPQQHPPALLEKARSIHWFASYFSLSLRPPSPADFIYYYIPEKSPYTLPLKRSCNKFSYRTITFAYCTLTRPRFSSNSKGAYALCLRNSIVCFGCVTKVPGRCYMACRHEKAKHFAGCRAEMAVSCVKCDLISRIMF